MTRLLNPAKIKQNKIWASGMGLRALLGDVQNLQSQKWRVEERERGKGAWVPRDSCRQQIRAEAAMAGAEQNTRAQTGERMGSWKEIRRPSKAGGRTQTLSLSLSLE